MWTSAFKSFSSIHIEINTSLSFQPALVIYLNYLLCTFKTNTVINVKKLNNDGQDDDGNEDDTEFNLPENVRRQSFKIKIKI